MDSSDWPRVIRVLAVAFSFAAAGCLHLRLHTDGTVVDPLSKLPVPGAQVTAECRRDNLFHGSHTVAVFKTSSDDLGAFRFSQLALARCDFMFVEAAKVGYVMTRTVDGFYEYSNYQQIPRTIFLTRVGDERLVVLDSLLRDSNLDVRWQGLSDAESQSARVFANFSCSVKVAETPKERQFVREHFCERLKSAVHSIGATGVAKVSASGAGHCKAGDTFYRPAIEPSLVDEFCAQGEEL